MSRIVEGLVKSGQHKNLMSIPLEQNWGSTTTAGIRPEFLLESGASPLTQMSYGSIALFQQYAHEVVVLPRLDKSFH